MLGEILSGNCATQKEKGRKDGVQGPPSVSLLLRTRLLFQGTGSTQSLLDEMVSPLLRKLDFCKFVHLQE